jgi:hypothetical protein
MKIRFVVGVALLSWAGVTVQAGYWDAININFSDGGYGSVSGSLTGVPVYGPTQHWNNNRIVGVQGNPQSTATTDDNWESPATAATALGVPITVSGDERFGVSFYTGGDNENSPSQTTEKSCGGSASSLLNWGLEAVSAGQYSSCVMYWNYVPFFTYDVWWLAGNSGTPGDSAWHLAASLTNVTRGTGGSATMCGQYQSVTIAAIQFLSKDPVPVVGGLLIVR